MAPDEQSESPSPADEPAGEEEPSVFGNLPKTRPGARSPRRGADAEKQKTSASARAEQPETARTGQQERAGKAKPLSPPPRPRGQQRPEHAKPEGHGRGIEEVAWAGVAAAAEAATIGVRLANRALEAMRDAVDRR